MSTANRHKATARVLKAIRGTVEVCGGPPLSDAAMDLFEAKLAQYPEHSVLVALDRCLTEVTGRLTLAHIIERIPVAAIDAWPTADEAWAAVGTLDEARTLVCVHQAFEALGDVRRLLESDEIGARMAFKDAYKRRVDAALASGLKPGYRASLGADKADRERMLNAAIERGLLNKAHAEGMLGQQLAAQALPTAAPGQGLRLLRDRAESGPEVPRDPAMRAERAAVKLSELLATFVNPELARKALEERRNEWGSKPIAKSEAEYTPPGREEVARIRAERARQEKQP